MIHLDDHRAIITGGSVSLTRRPCIAGVLPHVHPSVQQMAW
jgi:hypothetical protein